MKIDDLLNHMWKTYTGLNPHIKEVLDLIKSKENTEILNDHIALRTFNHQRINKNKLADFFLGSGYKFVENLHFDQKRLDASYYIHPNNKLPRIFISELRIQDFSTEFQNKINDIVDGIDKNKFNSPLFLTNGTPWEKISYLDYKMVQKESDYAAWVLSHGYIANHFTVSVTDCTFFKNLQQINLFLKQNGFEINSSGGEIKGSPKIGLEQSSIMAKKISVAFSDGIYDIPGCYYEFAFRYNGFDGFITSSANHIFESTNEKKA